MAAFLTGALVGFSIAAPVGPIGALTIRRTLAEGPLTGLATGLGAATADAAYGAIAAFGLTLVTAFLVAQQAWLHIGGGVLLCWLGWRAFTAAPAPLTVKPTGKTVVAAYASTFALTLANPATILSFIGIYAGLGFPDAGGDYRAAALFVGGVFTGSALWWLLLTIGVAVLRERLSTRGLRWVNRISGLTLAGFGVAALLAAYRAAPPL